MPTLKYFGVYANTGRDMQPPLQKAIDWYIAHNQTIPRLPDGTIEWGEGVVISPKQGNQFVTQSLMGSGNSFDPQLGSGTRLILLDKNEAAIYIQRGKGCEINDLNVVGQNTGLRNFSYDDVINERDNFNPNGCLDARTAMHCLMVVDAFNKDAAVKYEKKLRYYKDNNEGGSTSIRTNNITGSDFIAGTVISPAGTKNGEHCTFINTAYDHMKVGFSSGDPQNRSNKVFVSRFWGKVRTCFSTIDYGLGCPFDIDGFNIANGVKEMFNTGSWYGNQEYAVNGHAEEMYRIGGNRNGRDSRIVYKNSKIYLMGSVPGQRFPSQIAQCKSLHMVHSELFTGYSKPPSLMHVSADYVTMDNCQLDNPVIGLGNPTKYIDCDLGLYGRGFINGTDVLVTTSATGAKITAINEADNTWEFESDKAIGIGEYVTIWKSDIKSEFNYGNPLSQGTGKVVAKDGNKITVKGLTYKMAVGQDRDIYTYKVK